MLIQKLANANLGNGSGSAWREKSRGPVPRVRPRPAGARPHELRTLFRETARTREGAGREAEGRGEIPEISRQGPRSGKTPLPEEDWELRKPSPHRDEIDRQHSKSLGKVQPVTKADAGSKPPGDSRLVSLRHHPSLWVGVAALLLFALFP